MRTLTILKVRLDGSHTLAVKSVFAKPDHCCRPYFSLLVVFVRYILYTILPFVFPPFPFSLFYVEQDHIQQHP